MRDGWRAAVLGDVVYVDIERESVSPEKEYSIAGVRNAGQGMFGRGVLQGTATNYQILHRLRLDQVVMRKLTAWEGPVTVVPPEFDGFYVSTEFPTFTIDHELILPEFVDLLCQRPSFWQALKDRSIGTVQRRKRVSPSAFLTVPILLPPLTEQRRIVDLIRAVTAVSNAEQEADAASVVETALLRQVETLGPRLVDLAEVVTVAKSGGTPRRSNTAYFGGGIPWLKSGEVDQDYISATHESLTEAGLAASSAWLMPPRSIVVAMYGQGLTAGSVGFTALAMATNQAVLGLVPNGTKINP